MQNDKGVFHLAFGNIGENNYISVCVCGQHLKRGSGKGNSIIGESLGKYIPVPDEGHCGSMVCRNVTRIKFALENAKKTEIELKEAKDVEPHKADTRYDKIYEWIYRYTEEHHGDKVRNMEHPKYFNKTNVFNNNYLDGIIKRMKLAFWANKVAHYEKGHVEVETDMIIDEKEKANKISEGKKRYRPFFTLKDHMIGEMLYELSKEENEKYFPSWGFRKDENNLDVLAIDVPGKGQFHLHVFSQHIKGNLLNSKRYPYRYNGGRNHTFPDYSGCVLGEGRNDAVLMHNILVARQDWKGLEAYHRNYKYKYYYNNAPVNEYYVKGEKNELIPLHEADIKEDCRELYAVGKFKDRESTEVCFFRIDPRQGKEGSLKDPFHKISFSKGDAKRVWIITNDKMKGIKALPPVNTGVSILGPITEKGGQTVVGVTKAIVGNAKKVDARLVDATWARVEPLDKGRSNFSREKTGVNVKQFNGAQHLDRQVARL